MTALQTDSDRFSEFERDLIALVPYVQALSRSLCRNSPLAEDMAQEALANAWCHRNRFERGSNLRAWLFTILRHGVYSHARRAWRQVPWDEALRDRIPATTIEQESAMELSDCARAMNTLPKNQREALLLVGASGLTYDEAAKRCVTSAGTMKSRVARGRASLLDTLDNGSYAMNPRTTLPPGRNSVDRVLHELSALTTHNAATMPIPQSPLIEIRAA